MPYRFRLRSGYVELELYGVLSALEPFTSDEWRQINEFRALLYNYDEVEGITYDPWTMVEPLKRAIERGIRIASYAQRPAWFGVTRQLTQISEASDGAVRLFKDRAEAVAWLLHGDARPD